MEIKNTNRFIVMLSILASLSTSLIYQVATYGFPSEAYVYPDPTTTTTTILVPTITSISPTNVVAGSVVTPNTFPVTITGTNFVKDVPGQGNSVVRLMVNFSELGTSVNNRSTVVDSETQLTVNLTAADLATAKTIFLRVYNPGPDSPRGTSNPATFIIRNATGPWITGLSPTSTLRRATNGSGQSITISGVNFVSGSSKVTFGQFNNPSTGIVPNPNSFSADGTQFTVEIPVTYLTNQGRFDIKVWNTGTPHVSNPFPFEVWNPAPTVSSISPNQVTAGSPSFTLTVNGTGFVPISAGSQIRVNGVARPATAYIPATSTQPARLQTDIGVTEIRTATDLHISVYNPPLGGGVSQSLNLTVNAPNAPPVTTTTPRGTFNLVKRTTGGTGDVMFNFTGVFSDSITVNTAIQTGVNTYNLNVGTYTITESSKPGWSLSSIVCTSNGMPNGTANLANRSTTFTITANTTTTCTFRNTNP